MGAGDGGSDAAGADGAMGGADARPIVDLPIAPDGPSPPDGPAASGCAAERLDGSRLPVRGTARGATVDGVVCQDGLGTAFEPQTGNLGLYAQTFDTTMDPPLLLGLASSGGQPFGFAFSRPTDAQAGVVSGWVGAGADPGTFDSGTACGWLDFEVTLPIPNGVVCPASYDRCGPDCSVQGELGLCMPKHATRRYGARTAAPGCQGNQELALGGWQLTITSVAPAVDPGGLREFDSHGHLTATLVNEKDPSDTVVLDLVF